MGPVKLIDSRELRNGQRNELLSSTPVDRCVGPQNETVLIRLSIGNCTVGQNLHHSMSSSICQPFNGIRNLYGINSTGSRKFEGENSKVLVSPYSQCSLVIWLYKAVLVGKAMEV